MPSRPTQAKVIGDAMRAKFAADEDTGVVTQRYRVAGTPNFPSKAKRARGRTTIEPTKLILGTTGKLWELDELLAALEASKTDVDGVTPSDPTARYYKAEELITALSAPAPGPQAGGPPPGADEATLPDDLLEIIRHGAAPGADRSEVFHKVVADLERRHWTTDAIVELLERYPGGIAEKYQGRVRQEVERSYGKIAATVPRLRLVPVPLWRLVRQARLRRQVLRRVRAPHITSFRLSVSSPGSCPRSPQQIAQRIDCRGVRRSSPGAARWSSRSLRPWPRPTGARPSPPGCAPCRSIPCSGRSPMPQSSKRFNRKRKAWVDVDPPLQLVRMVLMRGTAMGLSARERDHHHADPARRWLAACGPRL